MNQMENLSIGSLLGIVIILLPSHLSDLLASSNFVAHSFSLVMSGDCTCKSTSSYLLSQSTAVKVEELLSTTQKLVLDWWTKF